ncbi:hypothetical protein AYL99_04658 [Fonsecaea erecta]|uniref:Uncharacterized protein n=1 Tax=Fonsecaea erecta TaxID=1367422 RepID=A0A178ZTU5_9EURO|nr:hypothetical protein AYL99_04658 [Fonsecaea erecta]OAP62455.1 hypothetical protein AYL99_04658 [Fonsecaea erecta]
MVAAKWDQEDVTGSGQIFLVFIHFKEPSNTVHTSTKGSTLKGKKVAAIGTGSNGIQIVAKIAEVEHLFTWTRSPTRITAGFAQRFAFEGGGNFEYTPEQQLFKDNPKLYLERSRMIEPELNQRFKFILKNTPESKAAQEYAISEMTGT